MLLVTFEKMLGRNLSEKQQVDVRLSLDHGLEVVLAVCRVQVEVVSYACSHGHFCLVTQSSFPKTLRDETKMTKVTGASLRLTVSDLAY